MDIAKTSIFHGGDITDRHSSMPERESSLERFGQSRYEILILFDDNTICQH